MNIPGGHPPARFGRFLASGAVNWRSVSDWILTGRHFVIGKPAWLRFFRIWKNKALPLPGHLYRLKMVHVDSQVRDFWLDFWSFWIDNLSRQCTLITAMPALPEKPRWKSENDFIRALKYGALGHFYSQTKESSDSLRRRHSSGGVDTKFSSTLPKDWLQWRRWCRIFSSTLPKWLCCGKNKYLDTAEIWIFISI